MPRADGEGRGDFAGRALLHIFDDVCNGWKVTFDAADDFFIDVSEVVKGHPGLPQALSERLRIKCKLHEDVHLGRLLTDDKLAIVGGRQLIKSEEAQVGEDLVQRCIVTVCAAEVLLEKHFRKNL